MSIIKCRRQGSDKVSYWACMHEDQVDGYGDEPWHALGALVMELKKCYEAVEQPMPYIKSITLVEGEFPLPAF